MVSLKNLSLSSLSLLIHHPGTLYYFLHSCFTCSQGASFHIWCSFYIIAGCRRVFDYGSWLCNDSVCMDVSAGCSPVLNGNEMNAGWKWISKGHGASSRAQHCPSHSCLNNARIITQREERAMDTSSYYTLGTLVPPSSSLSLSLLHTHTWMYHTLTQVEIGRGGETLCTNGVLH